MLELIDGLHERLGPLSRQEKTRYPRWIVTPEGDLGEEWCSDCGYFKVRNLRRHDRKRREDYILDGGWRTEEEHFCHCAGCGVRLDVSLLEYGVDAELDHYASCGFSTNLVADAYEIDEMLSAVNYTVDDRKPDERERQEAVIALATLFLEQADVLTTLQPSGESA